MAWRELHRTGPPQGLSRDLLSRALAHRLQEQNHGGTSRAQRRRLQKLASSEFAGNFTRFGYSEAFQVPENICESNPLRSEFPRHRSREFLRRSREFNRASRERCGGIRDLALSVAIILVI